MYCVLELLIIFSHVHFYRFLMGVFTYVYYSSLIRETNATVGSILQLIVSSLSVNEQLELMADLKRYIEGQGITVSL